MSGRPPLPIGQHGDIRCSKPDRNNRITAYCQYRDLDGRTRQVSARGPSEATAKRELRTKLSNRAASTSGDITSDTRFEIAAERWYAGITAAVESGDRSPSTAAQYRCFLDRHVLPALGKLRLREVTTGRVDAVLIRIRNKSGSPTARSCRTVMSGVLGWAARQDAVATNATRNTSRISTKPRKQPRALTVEECARWLQRLATDPKAVKRDLVDLTAWMLATGCRIGEALAVAWDDLDLIGVDMLVNGAVVRTCTVRIDWTICRVPGKPLFRKGTKTAAGKRVLRLPEFAVTMLRRRAAELYVLATGVLPVQGGFGHIGNSSVQGKPGVGEALTRRDTPPEGSGHFGHAFGSSETVDVGDLTGVVDVATALASLAGSPVFPDSIGGWRDPSNTRRDLRHARGTDEFAWVTSHSYRKTAATLLDSAGLTARQIADQLGHSRVSLVQDVYLSREAADPHVALALQAGLSRLFPMHKPSTDLASESQHLA